MATLPWTGQPAMWVTPWALSLREDAPMPNRGNTSPERAAHHSPRGVSSPCHNVYFEFLPWGGGKAVHSAVGATGSIAGRGLVAQG
jgi:hypothetical protein